MEKRPRVLVTLDGYAVEGGFDGPHQPATCFTPTIALGRHEGPGDAAQLWRDYEEVLDLVPDIGVDGVRLTLEWARIEPRRGVIDDVALARYVRAASYARGLGLDLVLVLVDRAWPSWLGLEAWLLPWVAPALVHHARAIASAFADVTDEIEIFADRKSIVTSGFVDATAPPWRRNARADAVRADRQLLSIIDSLRDDRVVGSVLVEEESTVSVGLTPAEITRARALPLVSHVFVRSLVKGSGPTGSPTGLLSRTSSAWAITADQELLDVFG